MLTELDPVMTPAMVAEAYSLSERWLARHRFQRTGPRYIKAGRRILYRRSDIEAYLAEATVEMQAA